MEKLTKFWRSADKYLLLPIGSTVGCSLLILATFAITYNQLPSKLPLFYSLAWGPDQLASKSQYLLLPFIMVLIGLVNILISSQLHPAQVVVKRVLMVNIMVVNFIILITALKIIFIFI